MAAVVAEQLHLNLMNECLVQWLHRIAQNHIDSKEVVSWEKLSQASHAHITAPASHAATLITSFLSIGLTCIFEHTP